MANTHTTLTSLFTNTADGIRSITGETGTIVADNFPTELAEIAAEVEAQAELIAQIAAALEGKAAGGTENTTSYELCSFTLSARAGNLVYMTLDASNNLTVATSGTFTAVSGKTVDCVKGMPITLLGSGSSTVVPVYTNCSLVADTSYAAVYMIDSTSTATSASVDFSASMSM